jgi:4,5-DOPA dioxygenase extradiol
MEKMPAIFISHGPPLIAQSGGPTVDFFKQLGKTLDRPKAIICVSAHWESVQPKITGADNPETVHDFGGPPGLFSINYPVKGNPALAAEAGNLLALAGFTAEMDPERGLDHGVWIPMMFIFPEPDIPVIQLSLQTEENPAHHFRIGNALKKLRNDGVLIIGSGGAVHNLDEVYHYKMNDRPPDYVSAFDRWLNRMITAGDKDALLDYHRQSPEPEKCHPYPAEHLLPLFVCLGAADEYAGKMIHHSFLFGTLGMAAYEWH